MGVFTLMYETEIAPKIELAVADAMSNEVRETALRVIEESANERIYQAYSPRFWSRRGNLTVDSGYDTQVDGNTLTITAIDALQNLYGGTHSEDLGDIIAEGWSNFNMPFARPWMDEGVKEHLSELETALANGMKRQGF